MHKLTYIITKHHNISQQHTKHMKEITLKKHKVYITINTNAKYCTNVSQNDITQYNNT